MYVGTFVRAYGCTTIVQVLRAPVSSLPLCYAFFCVCKQMCAPNWYKRRTCAPYQEPSRVGQSHGAARGLAAGHRLIEDTKLQNLAADTMHNGKNVDESGIHSAATAVGMEVLIGVCFVC